MTDCSSDETQIFRAFWHGSPLSQYQLLCLRSFVAHGHRVEVFTYDDLLTFPDWIVRRDAQEILPADRILKYQSGPGQGSPSLHSNLFRYALLHRVGGWWTDMDVVLLRSQLPANSVFFTVERQIPAARFGTAVMKLPPEHPLLSEAIERCQALGESATWSQTGPVLFTELVNKHQMARYASPQDTAYPILSRDFAAFFDPSRCNEVRLRCKQSTFVHLWNEMWRRNAVPTAPGPPLGSFLEWLIRDLNFDLEFSARLPFVASLSHPSFAKGYLR